MVNFFRENKSARDAVLAFVVALFCVGALFNNTPSKNIPRVGKRQIDLTQLQDAYQQIIKHNPELDGAAVQQQLINQQLRTLKAHSYIEDQGLKPSPEYLKTIINQQLPQGVSLSEFSKQTRQQPKQLLQRIQDNTAQQMLANTIASSAIVTKDMKTLHQHTLEQVRHYVSIDLSQAVYEDDTDAYQAIFEQHHFTHPEIVHYQYVHITPESLNLPSPSEEMVSEFFQKNLTTYADQDIEYQITTYMPSEKTNITYKPWPEHIQKTIDAFKEQHTNLQTQTETYKKNRMDVPEAYQTIVQKLKPGQHAVVSLGEHLSIISLTEKIQKETVSPQLKNQLYQDCRTHYHQVLMQQKIKLLSEYAYTHPESLEAFAKRHQLAVQSEETHTLPENMQHLMSNPEFKEKRYISDPIKHSDNTYSLAQLVSITPKREKTYEEALPNIRSVYFQHVVLPQLTSQLSHARSVADLEPLCQQYQLTLQFKDSEHHPSLDIQRLTPTRLDPKPHTISEGYQWLQLQSISYTDKDIDANAIAAQLDTELYFSSIHDTQKK